MSFWLRMTSRVVFFFLVVSLISFNTADPPPGIKVRITENAKSLKELGLMYLNGLVTKQFSIENLLIKSVTLTSLQVDPAQVDFRFLEKIGLQFEIRDLKFSLELQRELNMPFFTQFNIDRGTTIITGEGVSAMIIVKINQNPKGHLNVEIPSADCTIRADTIRTTSTGFLGNIFDVLTPLYKYFFNNKICPALEPMINNKLRDLPMMKTLHEGRQLDLDYSLSSDIAVTSKSLDISFKGLMSVHGQAVDTDSIRPGKEPVFTETKQMVYVGISELFFNGAAMSIYKSGPFEVEVPKLKGLKVLMNSALEAVGITQGLLTVELTEAPIIKIKKDNVNADVNFKAQSKGQQESLLSCKLGMNVKFEESRLIPVIKMPSCQAKTEKLKGKIVVGVAKTILYFVDKLFVEGIPIPLPIDLSFIDAKIQFEEGYLMVGGSLKFNPLQSSSNTGR
ncbi:hypothetical protein ACER0C_002015 [Sarotherodon galilaeus]